MSNEFRDKFPYDEVRGPQGEILDILKRIYANDKYRYIVIEAGTGVGKSAIAKAIAGVEQNVHILTATKQLQDQYAEFDDGTVEIIKGKANYQCAVNTEMRCSSGVCKFESGQRRQCLAKHQCPYYNAKDKAEQAETSVSSYAYFLSQTRMTKYTETKLPRNAIIIDECHLLEDQLISFAGFSLSVKNLDKKYEIVDSVDDFERLILLNSTRRKSGYADNAEWITLVRDVLAAKRDEMQMLMSKAVVGDTRLMTVDELESVNKVDRRKLSYKIDDINNLIEKINAFIGTKFRESWLVSVVDDGLKIEPLEIENMFHTYIGRYAKKHVVFMSATILNKPDFCRDIGLTPENTAIIVKQSTFDSRRSPIVDMSVGSMSFKNIESTMPEIVSTIKEILQRHRGQKGIIHTSTYNISNYIVQSINSKRFVSSLDGISNEEMLAYHRASTSASVLVSPSMMTGIDLDGDLARFQIIVKMPFASMKDPRVKTKMNLNKTWYLTKMMRSFVQACGRGTRSETDWCITYVLDNAFPRFANDNRDYLGDQFSKRIVLESRFNYKEFVNSVK